MNTKIWISTALFVIIALALAIQPAAAQSFLDPGYKYEIGSIYSGDWKTYEMDVTSSDDYDILALVYSQANDFDLYVYDPVSASIITEATAPYSTENGLNFIWAVSSLKPGRYIVEVHANSGTGNFAFIHFYNRQPILKTIGSTDSSTGSTTTTVPPVTTATPTAEATSGQISGTSSGSHNQITIINQNELEGTYYRIYSSEHTYSGYIEPGDELVINGVYPGIYRKYVQYGTGWNSATQSFSNPISAGIIANPDTRQASETNFPSSPYYLEYSLTLHTANGNVILI